MLISLRLSQGDLGRLVGLSRETVNAILQEWREQHLLEMDRRSVRLRDPARLRQVSAPTIGSDRAVDPAVRPR